MKASHSSVSNGLSFSERPVSKIKRVIEEEPLAMCSRLPSFLLITFFKEFCLFLLTVKGMCMP